MTVLCACGCGTEINPTDKYGRPHKFIKNHHRKGIIAPKEEYNTRRGKSFYAWNGGKYIGSDGYIMVYISPGKYIREHRLIMEKYLGRKLLDNEVVHHKNAIKTDNSIDNLELVSDNRNHHKLHHKHKRDPITGRFI